MAEINMLDLECAILEAHGDALLLGLAVQDALSPSMEEATSLGATGRL